MQKLARSAWQGAMSATQSAPLLVLALRVEFAGHKAGTFQLKLSKLRRIPFETAILGRYRRRESSVEEALVEK